MRRTVTHRHAMPQGYNKNLPKGDVSRREKCANAHAAHAASIPGHCGASSAMHMMSTACTDPLKHTHTQRETHGQSLQSLTHLH